MKCIQCHWENPENANFCTRCGSPLPSPAMTSFCPRCGAPTAPEDAYCGLCRAPLAAGHARFEIHKYSAEFARQNRAYRTFGHIYRDALLLSLPIILFATATIWLGEWGFPLVIGGTVICLAGIIGYAAGSAKYLNASKSAFVEDRSTGMLYMVTFVGTPSYGWNTATRAMSVAVNARDFADQSRNAQLDRLILTAVEDFLNGRNQPGKWEKALFGSEITVVPMEQVQARAEGSRRVSLEYTDGKGRRKRRKIANAYPTLKI